MKNKYKIILLLFSIIALIILIATTLADYVSSASGNGSVDVAKWHVAVGNVDISSAGTHDISTEIEMIAEEVDGVMEGKVAPESKLVGSFTIDPLDTEVDIEYEVTIGEFSCVGETEYIPDIEITAVTINDNTITLNNNKLSGKINLGDGPATIKIYAYWSSSEQDYLIGENIEEIQLPINVFVEQSAKKWNRMLDLYKTDKLHIGDFITYDAGTWTEEEIDSIQIGPNSSLVKPNKTSSAPNSKYQFGGFTAGMSRNDGTNGYYNSSSYMYAKMYDDGDTSNKVPISGWRIWDIDEENDKIVLISAADPESYYHINETNGAYIAEYLLTGNKNASWGGNISDYTKREWDMYENSLYNAFDAKILNNNDLNAWYLKYTSTTLGFQNATTFGVIYRTPYEKYQSLVDNHSYYWLGVANSNGRMRYVDPNNRYVNYSASNYALGVRVLVSIPLESLVKNEPLSERTVTLEGMAYNGGTWGSDTEQTYNVWELR